MDLPSTIHEASRDPGLSPPDSDAPDRSQVRVAVAVCPRSLLTTREAAAYCGFKTTGAIRKARSEGRLEPAGRRGGTGTWMWEVDELDRFLRGEPPGKIAADRLGTPSSEGGVRDQTRKVDKTLENMGNANHPAG